MRTQRTILLLLWCCIISTTSYSREKGAINGRIIDKSTGQGLSNVNIIIVDSRQGTASNADGEFRIDNLIPRSYTLHFSAIGYKNVTKYGVIVRPDEVTLIEIQLEPAVIEMEKIVVTATRYPRLLEQTPDVTIVQNFAEIRAMGAKQVDEIIAYMPGISTLGGTGSGHPFKRTVSINGMPAYYSLILLDGRRVLSSHIHTGTDVNMIPPEHIERIELLKGAASALYGTDGMGGTLNIITRQGSEKTRISFISYGGSRKTFHNGLSLTGKISNQVYHSLFTSWDESDGMPIVEPIFRKDKLSYTMFHLMDRFDAEITSGLKGTASFHYMNTEAPYQQNPQASWLVTPDLKLDYTISNTISVQTSGYYSQWKSQQNSELNEIVSPEFLINYKGLKNHQILLGTEYIYRNFARIRVAKHKQRSFGAFLQDEFSYGPQWHFLAALRLDKVENIDPVWSPKLSVLYNLNENLALRTSIGRGFRAATVHDLYETLYSHPGDIHYRAGNPDLQPEYSTTLNASINWKLSDRLSVMINGYYYSIDNMITPVDHGLEDPTLYFPREQIPFVTDSLVYIYRRENIHQGRIGGGEIKMLWYFMDGYTFEGGFCILHNKNQDTGKTLPYYPGKSLSLKLQGNQSITNRLTIGGFIGLNATMGRKIWRFKHDSEQQLNLDNYQKLDAGLSLSFQNGYELFLNFDNLLCQEIHLYEDVDFIIEGTPLYRVGIRLQTN
jgi:outer membrane receptor for ferrienterochelin and colicins